jgi:type I restriction enzyme, S subunit
MNKVSLKDLCFENSCGIYGIPASAEKFSSTKTRYLRITDISEDGKLLNSDKKSVSDDDIEKYILKEGDIVFARTGNSTGKTYYHENKNGVLAYAGFLIKYSLDPDKVNPKYIRYFTISKYYNEWVDNLSLGSTRGNINANTFKICPILFPERNQQDILVKVLSNIDSKIELNNRINQELEAMAKTLYNYWFVQFDFPNEQGKPYKSSGGKMVYNEDLIREIPEDWDVRHLNEITPVSNESKNPLLSPDIDFKHYSIPVFDVIKTYGIEKGTTIKSNKFTVEEADVLVSKLNPWFKRIVYPMKEENLICSTEFVVWRTPNINVKNYLFYTAKNSHFIAYCTQNATGTSNSHKRVNPTVMMKYQVAYNENIVEDFGEKIDSWIKKHVNNQQENTLLTELRDWLLPMLMNGQVTVGEVGEHLSISTDHSRNVAAKPKEDYEKFNV